MMPVDAHRFRHFCGRFATGVTVASVLDPAGGPHGLTVSSFTSVSLEPPLILICVNHKASVIDHFRAAKFFGISILSSGQRAVSDRFARKGEDRFEGTPWHAGETGAPLVDGALAHAECRTVQRVTAGDHDVFIAEMIGAHVHEGKPLIYFTGRYRSLA